MGEGYSGLGDVESKVVKIESLTPFDREINEIIEKITTVFEKFKAAREAYRVAQAGGVSLKERAQLEIDLNSKTMSMYRLIDKMEKLGLSIDLENRSN